MTLRSLRPLVLVLAALALAPPAASAGATVAQTTDRGVIQAADSGQIVLRALDGSIVSFTVSSGTRVRLNGMRAAIAELKPGFVAAVVHDTSARALVILAFGTATITERGVVTALTRSLITLRAADGTIVSVALEPRTQFRFRGRPGARRLARPGATVVVRHTEDGPAKVVAVLKRARP